MVVELGVEQQPPNWLSGDYVREVIRDEMELKMFFGRPDRSLDLQARGRFTTAFNARQDVQRARGAVIEAERQLLRDVTDATKALEAAIKTVARKFEKPPRY